jgi:hypothetical protein
VRLRGEGLILTAAGQKAVLAVTANRDELVIASSIKADRLPISL